MDSFQLLFPSLFRCLVNSTFFSISVLAGAALLKAQHLSAHFREVTSA